MAANSIFCWLGLITPIGYNKCTGGWPSASTPPADKLSFGDCYKEQAMAFLLVAQQSIDLTESNNTYYC